MLRDDEKGGLCALAGDLGVSRSVHSSAYAHTNVGAASCKAPEVLFARHGDVLKYKPQPVDVWVLVSPRRVLPHCAHHCKQ